MINFKVDAFLEKYLHWCLINVLVAHIIHSYKLVFYFIRLIFHISILFLQNRNKLSAESLSLSKVLSATDLLKCSDHTEQIATIVTQKSISHAFHVQAITQSVIAWKWHVQMSIFFAKWKCFGNCSSHSFEFCSSQIESAKPYKQGAMVLIWKYLGFF